MGMSKKAAAQEFTMPLSRQFQFQALQENTLTFDITAKNNEDTIQQSLTVTALEDIQVEANIIGVTKV